MSRVRVRMSVTYDGLAQLTGAARRSAAAAVLTTAYEIENDAKGRAPVDTGTLRRSIHVEPAGEMSTVVGPGDIGYEDYVEFGTSKMAAQPYLTPAVEAARPRFNARIEKILEGR